MKGNIKLVIIYVFYDSGSGGCFLMESFREQFGVNGERMELQFGIMYG